MKYGALLAAVAVLFATAGIIGGGWLYALFWPALSFATVALGYFHFGLSVYGKSSGGVLSPINLLFLFPFFLCLWSGWYALQFFKREPAFHQLIENVFIGRRLFSREILDSDFERRVAEK